MAKKIIILNTKGGSGKSTTTENLADALIAKGKEVLVVDADRQGTTTMHFGHSPKQLQERSKTLEFGLFGGVKALDLVLHGGDGQPDLIPCYPDAGDDQIILKFYEEEHTSKKGTIEVVSTPKYPNRTHLLKELLEQLDKNYDYIIMDTPGSMNIMTQNCLTAADGAIIIMPPQRKAVDALSSFLTAYYETMQYLNPRLHNFGMLMTAYKPSRHQDSIVAAIHRELVGVMPTLQPVRFSTIFENTSGEGTSAVRRYPKDERIQPYLDLANTIVDYYEQ